MLHAPGRDGGGGLLKHQIQGVTNTVGPGQSKEKEKDVLDVFYHNLAHYALRQSEKDFPCISVCNGITDMTKISVSEQVGNM